jgi:PAS domain S-box-containing protein
VGVEACALVDPEDRDRIIESLAQALVGSGAGQPTSVRFRHKDGSWRVLEAISSPFRAEEGKQFVVVNLRDVTGRLDAERALRESEERFRSVFESGPIGMSVLGLDRRYLAVNRRYCEILGYEEEEVIGQTVMDITHPEDQERDQELGEQLISGRIPFYVTEKRLRRSDGQNLWVRVTGSIVWDEGGDPQYALGMIEDITEHKEAREREARLQERLNEALTKALSGYVGICSNCKLIRGKDGERVSLEDYVRDTTEARFSHGLCPSCGKRLYPQLDWGGSFDPES